MSRRVMLPFVAATLMIGTACSLVFAAPSTAPNAVPAGVYEIDPAHTSVLFSLSHLGYSQYYGRFNTVSGSLDFDPAKLTDSKLQVTVDVASIDTNHEVLESKLRGPEWFDVASHPKATFTATQIEKLSDTTGRITGNLALHGVTKPVTLDVVFNGGGTNPFANTEELGFSATGFINRSEFGISQYLPMVGDKVSLTIEAELLRKK